MPISADVDLALRRFYSGSYQQMQYQNNVLQGILKKQFGCGGDRFYQTVSYGAGAGQSATFTTAQGVSTALSKRARYAISYGKHYAIGKVDNDAIRQSQNDKSALVRILADEIMATMRKAADCLEWDLFGDGYGTVGIISAFATNTITMTRVSDALNFDVGSTYNLATAANAASLLDAGATGTCTAVNANTGVVTFAVNIATTFPSVAVTNTIHRAGDKLTATMLKTPGLAAWLPVVAPTGVDFTGTDRSVDSRQYGRIVSGVGKAVRDVILELATGISAQGGTPSIALLNYETFLKLQQEYENKTIADSVPAVGEGGKNVAGVFYNGFKISGPKGPITVLSAVKCPSDRLYVLQPDTICVPVVGSEIFQNTLSGGGIVMDNEATDSVEFRRLFQGTMSMNAPGWNGVATV